MAETLKQKAVNGVFWRIFEQGGRQMIQFVINVVLARLIAPDQFGMLAMLSVFIAVSYCFIDGGLGDGLFRKKDRTQADCSTVFWYSLGASTVYYCILFFCAPLISDFYGMPELTLILRVSLLTIVIGTLGSVSTLLLRLNFDLKALAKYNIAGLIVSGFIGITLAYFNFKVWALVFQNIIGVIITTACVVTKVGWYPSFVFSKASFKEFFTFGSKLIASRLLNQIYINIYNIAIGKIYKASDLAFYNRAYGTSSMVSSIPVATLQSVTYPLLVNIQDNDTMLKNTYRRLIKLCSFIVFPLCLGLGAVAFPLISTLYTDIWIYSATLLSIIVFAAMWHPIHTLNIDYLIVKGYSNLVIKLEIIKKIQGIMILCITIPMGLKYMCYGSIADSLLCLIWNTYYTGKFLKMTILDQLRDMSPTLILSGIMFVCARLTANYMGNGLASLICSVGVGVVVYAGGAFLFRFPELKELKNLKK